MAYENEKAEREFRMNPPDVAPGQGGDDDWGDLGIGSSSVESLSDSIITGGVNSQPLVGSTLEEQKPPENKDAIKNYTATEDMVIEKAAVAAKGLWHYFKALSDSFRNNSSGDWHTLGVMVSKVSLGGAIVGLIFVVVNFFSKRGNQPLDVIIGSLMSAIVGVGLCMWFDKDPIKPEIEEEDRVGNEDEADLSQWGALDDEIYDEEYSEESEYEEEYEEEISDDDWGMLMGNGINNIEEVSIESGDFSVENELEKVSEIPYGTQTRRYLYETFSRVLPKMTPNFSEMRFVPQDSDDFYFFESLIREAAYQVGTKDENLPELDTVYVNDFIYRLNCNRPVGIKEQLIADEVASTYSRDENNMEVRVGVYATTETSTGKYTINLFKGELKKDAELHKTSIKISLGDIYKDIESFVSDPDNAMPFVWGVNEFGKPIFSDIGDTNSFICSGEPRGGKSWKGQSLVAQLCMFNSPKEIEIYVFDPKNRQSDYRYAASVLPHIRYFCGDPNRVNEGIERVLNKAVTERERILSDNGCINIKDYNSKFPNNKLPYMYIVVDELMALMEHFSLNDMKEEANRFKGFLSVMVSKLANMGVRFVLFPHRIVDSVISKNTYSLISTRMVVNQSNPDDLKSALDITSKTFPYKLVSPGDMALRSKDIERGKVIFCHAEMLTSSNENNCKMFDFIGSVWRKLEPDCTCINVSGTICGTISINGPEKVATERYKVEDIDNTKGQSSYEYQGYGEDGGSSTEDILEEFEGQDSQVDETFWNNF